MRRQSPGFIATFGGYAAPHMPTTDGAANAEDRLQHIEFLTDPTLAQLDVSELLVELLDRVRDILDVDTAAVLLLDETSAQLVATAARGIEEEVRQGVRIPLAAGFAGRVATEQRPVIVDQVNHTNVLNPILREKGIQSMLGVPLVAGGRCIGVLHVGTLTARKFTADDADLLQVVADRAALAAQARISKTERGAALALQRSLLPDRLPDVPGLELAARYVPGEEGGVGGDWYDVFALPSGRICVAMGDVAGRGLRAAMVMGRLRTCLRAYALDESDPATVLERLDEQLQYFEPQQMATAIYGMFEPRLQRIQLSSAGHLPPALARPDQPGTLVEMPVDPPLGVDRGPRRQITEVEMTPGTVLCLYTDGLVERRDTSLEVRLQQLRDSILVAPAETVCAALMSRLVGAKAPNDDIAVLVLRRRESGSLHRSGDHE